MKKLSFLAVILVLSVFVASTVNATGLRTEFKEYEIANVDDLYIGKNVKAIWTLSYSDKEVPVTVVKMRTLEGVEYVVHSKHFEVSYAQSADGFGAKRVRNAWSNVPRKITKAVLSQEEFKRQAILTPNKVDDETALGLIASYLPDMVNDGYTHLLN